MQERIKDLIIQLKSMREREGLSIPQIVRMIEENGEHVSESTVRRILEDGSENQNFRPESIQPIERVLLKIDKDQLEGSSDEVRALKDIILLRDMEIAHLTEKIKDLNADLEAQEADARKRIDYLKDRVDYLIDQIGAKDELISQFSAQLFGQDKKE